MMDSVNYYGSLCTEMYELLHSQAPQDELAFYLSYAHPGDRVLELLCGSGRFLVPFVQRGFDITGVDLSQEMLEKLLQKYPAAKVHRCSADAFESEERFDYIFISSGSVSLFTRRSASVCCKRRMTCLRPAASLCLRWIPSAAPSRGTGLTRRFVPAPPRRDSCLNSK